MSTHACHMSHVTCHMSHVTCHKYKLVALCMRGDVGVNCHMSRAWGRSSTSACCRVAVVGVMHRQRTRACKGLSAGGCIPITHSNTKNQVPCPPPQPQPLPTASLYITSALCSVIKGNFGSGSVHDMTAADLPSTIATARMENEPEGSFGNKKCLGWSYWGCVRGMGGSVHLNYYC